jgi:hypothetical protein
MSVLKTEKLFDFDEGFWRRTGARIVRRVRADLIKGKMQDNSSNHRYRSEQYKKYKANSMRRVSAGGKINKATGRIVGAKKLTRISISKKTGRVTNRNRKLKGFEGVSTNTETKFVNLHLTNSMMKDYDVTGVGKFYVEIGFSQERQALKALGNLKKGYDMTGLSEENKGFVKSLISAELDRLGYKYSAGEIKIVIG